MVFHHKSCHFRRVPSFYWKLDICWPECFQWSSKLKNCKAEALHLDVVNQLRKSRLEEKAALKKKKQTPKHLSDQSHYHFSPSSESHTNWLQLPLSTRAIVSIWRSMWGWSQAGDAVWFATGILERRSLKFVHSTPQEKQPSQSPALTPAV